MFLISRPVLAQLPNFIKADCNGVNHNLYSDLEAGNAVILDFSAVWCPPCNLSSPLLEQLYAEFSSGQCKVKQYLILFDGPVPNGGSNCTNGSKYANFHDLTFPVITDIENSLVEQYFDLYDLVNGQPLENVNGIPMFLIILPNTSDPANSIVKTIIGYAPNLKDLIKAELATGGFVSPAPITITGDLCSDQPHSALLTSGFGVTGNLWSTGAITDAINVTQTSTYTVTNDGCTSFKYIEFNPVPVVGTATIANNTVCENGFYTLDYIIPQGGTTNVTWQYRKLPEMEWNDFVPAGEGSLTMMVSDPAGTEYRFKVKVMSGSGTGGYSAGCIAYSNEVSLTVTSGSPAILPGTASASGSEICWGSQYTLLYTGGVQNSTWEYYDDLSAEWITYLPADDQPFVLDVIYYTSFVNGYPGDKWRVRSPYANCYSLSNVIEVAYLPQPGLNISGPDLVCDGNTTPVALQISEGYSSVLWSTGATTTSIPVNPAVSTYYYVTVSDENGCENTAGHTIDISPKTLPNITSSLTGVVCPGGSVTLNFAGTMSVGPCTSAPNGQYPAEEYNFTTTDGTIELIADGAFAGQYSIINVVAGRYYYFVSQSDDDYSNYFVNTITNGDGSEVLATGFQVVILKAAFTGSIRFYSHNTGCGTDNGIVLLKAGLCFTDPSIIGSFMWMPGGETTPSITVKPAVTTNYSLTFTERFFGCSYTTTRQVLVGIGSLTLSTTNITSNSATLNWAAPLDPTLWQVEYKATKNGSKWKDVFLPGNSRSYTLTGLSSNQNYLWHIKAKCGKAYTDYSISIPFITTGVETIANKTGNTEKELMEITDVENLQVKAMPNPSNNNFRLVVTAPDLNEKIIISVLDIMGRRIESRSVISGQTNIIGEAYKPGIYILQAIQGTNHKEIKLVKIPD